MTAYIETMIGGIFTGIGVICGQYLWTEYIHRLIIKKAEKKIRGEKKDDDNKKD